MQYFERSVIRGWVLPTRTMIALASIITIGVAIAVFFTWLIVNTHFVLGTIGEVHALNTHHAVMEVHLPGKTQLAVVDELGFELALAPTEWLFGYGEKRFSLKDKNVLMLDDHTTLPLMPIDALPEWVKAIPPTIIIAIGCLIIVFGRLTMQLVSALLFGTLCMISSYHALHVGGFLDIWSMNDLVINTLSIVAAITGTAFGMRFYGGAAFVFHRIAAITLLLLFSPLITTQFSFGGELFVAGVLLVLIRPYYGFIAVGSTMVAHGLALKPSDSVAVFLVCLLVVAWLQYRQKGLTANLPPSHNCV